MSGPDCFDIDYTDKTNMPLCSVCARSQACGVPACVTLVICVFPAMSPSDPTSLLSVLSNEHATKSQQKSWVQIKCMQTFGHVRTPHSMLATLFGLKTLRTNDDIQQWD